MIFGNKWWRPLGGEYDYNKLRRALMAIVPRVNKEEDGSHRPPSTNRQWKPRSLLGRYMLPQMSAWMNRTKMRWRTQVRRPNTSREN